MKPLGDTYQKNGFHYEIVLREGVFAIAKQRLRPGVGCLAFEVIKIKQVKESTMFNRTIDAHESAPGNEEWGRSGWTFPNLDAAKEKFRELLQTGQGRAP